MTRRLLGAFLGLTVVVLLVALVPLGLSFADGEREDLLAGVERDAVAIAFFVEDELDPEATDVGIDLQAVADGYEARTGGRVVIVDRTGVALADSEPPGTVEGGGLGRDFASRPEVAAALTGEVARGTRASDTLGDRLVFVAVPVASGGSVDGAVRITYPTAEVDQRVRRNWLVLAGIAAVSLSTAGGLSLLLASSVNRPLRRLQAAATALGAGRLDARADTAGGPAEVRSVAEAFNRMAAQLEELVGSQEQFVADASHELRTPLTALKLRLEMLDGGADTDAALQEVDRMARLVDLLLVLARADRPDATTAAPIELGPFLGERLEGWQLLAADAEVALVLEVGAGTRVHGVADRLARIVDNLVANALDAAPAGSTVLVAAGPDPGGGVAVHVIDEGPGLTEEQRARAFDRFWRASPARGRFGGSGLGLAIVAKLCLAEGATVRLEPAPGGGIDAVVRYPSPR